MRFFYLTILAILIALSGCTMHPPSASGFMETAEQGQNDEKVRVLTARAEKINFSLSGDEWNIPIALETTTATRSGFVSGWGILPSPYVTFGYADKYFGWRSWVSAIWLGITVGAICATGACFEDDGDDDSYRLDLKKLSAEQIAKIVDTVTKKKPEYVSCMYHFPAMGLEVFYYKAK
jgi:hypothetical protein